MKWLWNFFLQLLNLYEPKKVLAPPPVIIVEPPPIVIEEPVKPIAMWSVNLRQVSNKNKDLIDLASGGISIVHSDEGGQQWTKNLGRIESEIQGYAHWTKQCNIAGIKPILFRNFWGLNYYRQWSISDLVKMVEGYNKINTGEFAGYVMGDDFAGENLNSNWNKIVTTVSQIDPTIPFYFTNEIYHAWDGKKGVWDSRARDWKPLNHYLDVFSEHEIPMVFIPQHYAWAKGRAAKVHSDIDKFMDGLARVKEQHPTLRVEPILQAGAYLYNMGPSSTQLGSQVNTALKHEAVDGVWLLGWQPSGTYYWTARSKWEQYGVTIKNLISN